MPNPRRRKLDNPWIKYPAIIISSLTFIFSVSGNIASYYLHMNDSNAHFINGEKKEYQQHLASSKERGLTTAEKGEIINHIESQDVHMTFEKKVEHFLTRKEYEEFQSKIDGNISVLNQSINRLIRKLDKLE